VSDHQSRKELKFLHTSDVHLGAYDHSKAERTMERRQEMHDTFRAVIDLSITERVDFMVIAGDFFDNARVQEDTMQFAGEQLARVPGPVILLPGNHDHVGPGSVYDRLDPYTLGMLLALYEHKTYVEAAIWGINPFDQWGVELGKSLAGQIAVELAGDGDHEPRDASTEQLLNKYHSGNT